MTETEAATVTETNTETVTEAETVTKTKTETATVTETNTKTEKDVEKDRPPSFTIQLSSFSFYLCDSRPPLYLSLLSLSVSLSFSD